MAEILRDAAKNQADAIRKRSNEPFADATWERNAAAALLGRDPREQFRTESKRFAKRGLGAAQLTALGADAMHLLLNPQRARGR